MDATRNHTGECGASESRQTMVVVGTVLAALAGSACCWGPPVALALLGSGAGWLRVLDAYQPYLLAFTALQLVLGFYLAYRPAKPCCERHRGVDPAARRRLNIGIMWAVAVFVVAINAWNAREHRIHPHEPTPMRTAPPRSIVGAVNSSITPSA